MATEQIPRNDWVAFFAELSQRHRGASVSLEVFGVSVGAQVEASDMPLEHIRCDLDAAPECIFIEVGGRPLRKAHVVTSPRRVHIKRTEDGETEALQIEWSTGTTTLMQFRTM